MAMPVPSAQTERRALLGSIVVSTALGVLGVIWGLAAGSQMILLDGIYGFVGVLLSWLLLLASALADAGPSRHYPYGREAATPLVIGVQGFVLLATLLYAGFEASRTILDGGSEVAAGWAIAYGTVTTIGSLATWLWLRREAGHSDLLVAEATAWRVAAMRGIGMVLGFTVLAMLTGSSWSGAAPYVDPVMVLVTCVVFVPAPIAMVRTTIIELLEGAPPPSIQAPVLQAVAEIEREFGLDHPEIRMTKIGPKLYVEVDAFVPAGVTVGEEHAVRTTLQHRLEQLPYEVWLNLELSPSGGSAEPSLP